MNTISAKGRFVAVMGVECQRGLGCTMVSDGRDRIGWGNKDESAE